MTQNKPTTPKVIGLYASLPARLRVFAVALISLVFSATGLCILVATKTFIISPALFFLWCSVLAGPFSALWVFPENPNLTFSFINLALLFAHPVWPNRIMATLTFLAFASWLLWGMAISLSGV
ncbi:MAG: hypothetical protein RJA22_790 [Verrucomicrobiota bacterium]|jgi:hypothetical protein